MSADIDSVSIVGSVQGAATRASSYEVSAIGIFEAERVSSQWNDIIDNKLIEWGRHPEEIADVNLVPPTPNCLASAFSFAKRAKSMQVPAPSRTLPDGDGGLVFEWCDGDAALAIEVGPDGKGEFMAYAGSRLIFRSLA